MAGKGKGKKKEKEPKDKFTNMEEDKLIEFIQKTREQIKEVKVKRNFVQQERDMITEFYEISKQEEKKLRDACEKEEIVMDHLQREHQNEINAFINKYRHLEYDHEIFINEKLPNKSQEAMDKEEQIRANREDIYMQKKQDLKDEIKTNALKHRDQIDSKKQSLQNNFEDKKRQLEERLKNIMKNYKRKMKQLSEDLELRLKVEIHELEERKNLHINNLNRTFDQKMKDWKNENINQIKESIKIIKQYIGVLKDYENDNKKLTKDNDALQKEIDILEAKYKEAKDINNAVKTRLNKYYNQDINMKNMKAKIISLKEKYNETTKKTEEIEAKKEETQEKIDDLKNKFRGVLEQYKSKTDHRNNILEKHIKQLNEDYEKRESEIEEILKNVDVVGNRNLGDDENKNDGLSKEFHDLLDHIKTTLSEKTIIIKRLKASLAVSAKAFNDTIRVYEAKLIEFGLPAEELGFQLLETNTSKMPAGLVSD